MSNVGFWKKESGNLMNPSKGLTEEQVVFLQSLKVGDRVILWNNIVKEGDNKPNLVLKKFESKPKEQQ